MHLLARLSLITYLQKCAPPTPRSLPLSLIYLPPEHVTFGHTLNLLCLLIFFKAGFLKNYLFIWLHWLDLSCSMWDLVP